MREAPSLDNVKLLLEAGADIVAFDPVGEDNFKRLYPEGENLCGTMHYVDSAQLALAGAHICFIFTEWKEIKEIKAEEFKELMHTALVYDGRNLYDIHSMKDAGVEYYSIGR